MPKLKLLPKVELHLHLDCSLSFDVVSRLDSSVSRGGYERDFIAPAHCADLADYLTRPPRCVRLMQTEAALRLVTLDLFAQLKRENLIYVEIRFAPLLHLEQGLSPERVVEAVSAAVCEGAQETGVEANLILCTLRHYNAAQSIETARLVERFRDRRVAAFDIAADEAGFPLDAHIPAFEYAIEHGIPRTAHAGEARGAGSVWETLRHLQPSRIGHGVRSAEDPALLEHLRRNNIHLEVCPSSNVQTNVYPSLQAHSVDLLFRQGVPLGINTDARTVTRVTLTEEYENLQKHFGWGKADLLECNRNAVRAAFTTDAMKEQLLQKLQLGWA